MIEPMVRGIRLQAAVDLAEKVAALARIETYPTGVAMRSAAGADVIPIETHMSWVFLAGDYAYKLKKPVRSALLDFSSRERRRWFCEEELRLNRRLAPAVYLEVATLRRTADGRLCIGDNGEIVDYLVKMRRLPAARMLDRAIVDHTLTTRDVRRVVAALVAFYMQAEPTTITAQQYRDNFIDAIELNRQVLQDSAYGLPRRRIERIAAAQRAYVSAAHCELPIRAAQRRIVDGHGDLRPEHIYLEAPVQIIDCLEFQRSLRLLDPADELAFLALECERLGAPHVARALVRLYRILSGDHPSVALMQFYRSHRASIRAKLAVWHLDDPAVRDRARWRRRAASYLDNAERASAEACKG